MLVFEFKIYVMIDIQWHIKSKCSFKLKVLYRYRNFKITRRNPIIRVIKKVIQITALDKGADKLFKKHCINIA